MTHPKDQAVFAVHQAKSGLFPDHSYGAGLAADVVNRPGRGSGYNFDPDYAFNIKMDMIFDYLRSSRKIFISTNRQG